MPKNALFLLKNCKNHRALGSPPPDPQSLAAGCYVCALRNISILYYTVYY